MIRLTPSVIVLALAGGLGAASAQPAQERTANIQPDKPARIHVVTALKKDCTQGDSGSIRVINAPKNGTTSVRSGKLKTPARFRCPNVETQVQQLIYEPRKSFQGTDEVVFETKDADGATSTQTIKINVSSKPPASAPKGGGGVVDL